VRKLIVDGKEYTYTVGKSYAIIKFEGLKIATIPLCDIKGSWDNLERGRWKKTRDGMVFPSEIVEYIRERK